MHELDDRHEVITEGDQAPLIAAKIKWRAAVADLIKRKHGTAPYKHVTLADVQAAVVPAALEHGLFIAQPSVLAAEGMAGVCTRIEHASGATESSYSYGKVEPGRGMSWMQAMGSTLTYLRKYELQGIAMLAGDDQDARDQRGYASLGRADFEPLIYKAADLDSLIAIGVDIGKAELSTADKLQLKNLYATKLAGFNDAAKSAATADAYHEANGGAS